jgi:hypothetical protein
MVELPETSSKRLSMAAASLDLVLRREKMKEVTFSKELNNQDEHPMIPTDRRRGFH